MVSRGFVELVAAFLLFAFAFCELQSNQKSIEVRSSPYRAQSQPKHKVQNPHIELLASVHPDVDKNDYGNLDPRTNATLFYTRNGEIYLAEPQLVATLQTEFNWTTVILDHSAWVKEVTCNPLNLTVAFANPIAFARAKVNWTKENEEIIMVSSKPGCHTKYRGQFGFFNATSVAINETALSITAFGTQISMRDAVKEYKIEWGEWTPSVNRPTATPSASGSPTPLSQSTTSNSSSRKSKSKTSHSKTKTRTSPGKLATTPPKTPAASSSTPTTSSTDSTSSATDSSTTSTPTKCGVLPSHIPDGLPELNNPIPCGPDFDKSLDDWMTYAGDDLDFDKIMSELVPGVSGLTLQDYRNSLPGGSRRVKRSLRKRSWFGDAWNWVNNNIVQPVVHTVEAVVNVVERVVTALSDAAQAVVNAIREAAKAVLPSFHPSISFTIPINMEVPDAMLRDSPWGDAFPIYKWEKGEGELNYGLDAETLAKMVSADELLTFEIDGVEQLPEPGLSVYCVDCYVKGSLKTRGFGTFTLFAGFTDMQLMFQGDIHALVQLGLDAFAEYEKEIAKFRIFEIGVPGWSIPEVITVGPMITMDADATVNVEALGQVLAGAKFDFDNIGATINFLDASKSEAHGFLPHISPVFNVSGEIKATASVGIPIGVGIGVDILDGEWSKEVALVDRPALAFEATYSASYNNQDGGTTGTDDCAGIGWNVGLVNEIELNILDEWKYQIGSWEGPKFLEGCVGDNGVNMVRQQQDPVPVGQTRAGCTVQSELLTNNGFDTIDPDNFVRPWSYSVNRDDMKSFVMKDDKTTSQPYSNRFYVESGGDTNAQYVGTAYSPFVACTASNYQIQFQMRQVEVQGYCKLTSVNVYSNVNPLLNVIRPLDVVLDITPDHMVPYGPFAFAVPAYNNRPQEPMYVGITVTCAQSSYFDYRIDDVSITPLTFDKRDNSTVQWMRRATSDDDDHSTPQIPVPAIAIVAGKPGNSPTISKSGDSPTITPSYVAPPLPGYTLDSPTMSFIPDAPSITMVPDSPHKTALPTTSLVGCYPANADPTATATRLGPADYNFPPFSKLMESATVGAVGSLPTDPSSTAASNGYTQLRDLTATVQLASADDGNLYLTNYPGQFPGTMFLSKESVIIKDEGDRVFHFHPGTMDVYGVSRFRAADIEGTPLDSRLATLIPVDTPNDGTIYAAVDTLGNIFYLAFCTSKAYPGAKVFLVRDLGDAIKELQSAEVQWVVTGAQVDTCAPVLLTSNAVPIGP